METSAVLDDGEADTEVESSAVSVDAEVEGSALLLRVEDALLVPRGVGADSDADAELLCSLTLLVLTDAVSLFEDAGANEKSTLSSGTHHNGLYLRGLLDASGTEDDGEPETVIGREDDGGVTEDGKAEG